MKGNMKDLKEIGFYTLSNARADPICQKNCLDVCVAYNNRWLTGGEDRWKSETR